MWICHYCQQGELKHLKFRAFCSERLVYQMQRRKEESGGHWQNKAGITQTAFLAKLLCMLIHTQHPYKHTQPSTVPPHRVHYILSGGIVPSLTSNPSSLPHGSLHICSVQLHIRQGVASSFWSSSTPYSWSQHHKGYHRKQHHDWGWQTYSMFVYAHAVDRVLYRSRKQDTLQVCTFIEELVKIVSSL